MVFHQEKVIWINVAMEKLHHYLLKRKFIARVDHKPLVAMMKNKLNIIMKYNFITVYLPGKESILADTLSCQFETEENQVVVHSRKSKMQPEITSNKTEQSLEFEAIKRGKRIPNLEFQQKLILEVHLLGHFGVETMFREIWH